jgi:hypothetical protein
MADDHTSVAELAATNGARTLAPKDPTPPAEAAAQSQAALLTADLRNTIRLNAWLNLVVRALLAVLGLTAGAAALVYTLSHGDSLVATLNADSSDVLGRRLLALTMPVLLLGAIAGLAAAAAWTTHSRGLDEMFRTLDTLNRVEREGEVAVSARGLIVAFEDKLQNARRAFTLLLWLGRSLFIVCLGLFAVAVVKAVLGHLDPATAALGVGSILGTVVGLVKGVPQTIAMNLAQVVEIESIVTGCDRQISLLESDAFAAMKRKKATPRQNHDIVVDDQERIEAVVGAAVERIRDCVRANRAPASRRRRSEKERRSRRSSPG